MGCTATGTKTFLVCCNVGLLFVGLSVLILGVKMKWAMSVLLLISIPMVSKAVQAVIATGFFISLSGITGICGACYESMYLLLVHLVFLGAIVIMEFSLGVTLMVMKKTIENALDSSDCNSMCAATVDAVILDYALPSAGLMMTIIFVEALMIYSSIKLYFFIRDGPKANEAPAGPSIVVQNVQMQNVAAPQPTTYVPAPQPMYAPQVAYMPPQPQPGYMQPQYIPQVAEQPAPVQSAGSEPKPPDYSTLPQQTQPPAYTNPEAATVPKEADEASNPV